RKTVYALRQQLLLGRYEPDEVDELGKPTGKKRALPVDPAIKSEIEGLVAQLVGMFGASPLQVSDANGRARAPSREEIGAIEAMVDLETLQREVYHLWGVKFELTRKQRAPLELYDELVTLVSQGLTEQRERLL